MMEKSGPLAGMRVIELTHIMAGPTCGQMLADMGADVIKVESHRGDDMRHSFPPDVNGVAAAFLMMNRNKRGIVLDLKSPEGKKAFEKLVESADVVMENFRSGTMDRLGLGYEDLKKRKPDLIYCAITGFGMTGPYAQRGGFDLIAQGMSGLMSITGEGEDRPPVKVGAPVTDITAGILAAMGICAAYAHRLKTGEGQMIDTSLFEAGITHTYWQSAIAFATGTSPGPLGSAHPLNAPYQAFATKDGWINVGAANQRNWERLCAIIGAEHLLEDARFKDNAGRMGNLPALVEELNAVFMTKTSAEWLEAMEKGGLPAGPVLSVAEMHADPQAIARGMIAETIHPVAGPTKALGHPLKYSKTPVGEIAPAPLLGQHTRELLAEAGYSDDEIAAMIEKGAALASD